jgi:hypothetical protein
MYIYNGTHVIKTDGDALLKEKVKENKVHFSSNENINKVHVDLVKDDNKLVVENQVPTEANEYQPT